jgi:Ubiquinone biosynthesis protein COQ7
MAERNLNTQEVTDLLYQSLETELGGTKIYTAAISCALRDDLKTEWRKYLSQTKHHVEVMQKLLTERGLDPSADTPGRQVVRHIGESLVAAIQMAAENAPPEAAQIVAAECVVLAETKDHMNWELIGKVGDALGKEGKALRDAYEEIEDEEDEHLYHTKGWARELWIEGLGMPAVLPPPEEVKDVSTAIGAARAEQSRDQML